MALHIRHRCVGAGSVRLGERGGRITTSSDCSTKMGATPWGAFNQHERIHTAVFELHGPVRWGFLSTIPMARCISLTTLDTTSQDDPSELDLYFRRVSYLCKAATKVFGNHCRVFGCGRG